MDTESQYDVYILKIMSCIYNTHGELCRLYFVFFCYDFGGSLKPNMEIIIVKT